MQNRMLFFFIILLFGCSEKYYSHTGAYRFKSADGKPDYSNLDYWAAHPYKQDLSDSVPQPLQGNYHPDSTVDIFFIHPTTYTSKEKNFGWNAPVDNDTLNAKTDYSTILYQASVFNEAGRVFAPRYRQANLAAYYPVTQTDTLQAIHAFDLAYNDVKTAFEYYLSNWNKGRPFIIASHSQGTTHAKRLIKEYIEGTNLQNRLVAAYIIGIVIEPGYFNSLKPCTNPNQTGCFCSWRTFKEGYIPDFVAKEKFTAIVTNPITWDSSRPKADRKENPGGILLNFNKKYANTADAIIHDGILWTRKPKFFGNILYTSKNFHIADYNLYYYSIRQNVQQRINAFWKK